MQKLNEAVKDIEKAIVAHDCIGFNITEIPKGYVVIYPNDLANYLAGIGYRKIEK